MTTYHANLNRSGVRYGMEVVRMEDDGTRTILHTANYIAFRDQVVDRLVTWGFDLAGPWTRRNGWSERATVVPAY